jgi:hypothetical protein
MGRVRYSLQSCEREICTAPLSLCSLAKATAKGTRLPESAGKDGPVEIDLLVRFM